MTLGDLINDLLGPELPVAIRAYDGTVLGPPDAPTTMVIRSPDALARVVQAPGELGFARAYVAGDLDLEGDIFDVLALRDQQPSVHLTARQWLAAGRLLGPAALRRLPVPPEEARLHGRRHSKSRDQAAVSYHYDVSNDFYRILLGPSMTYSCGRWGDPPCTLEEAQRAKYELICTKLGLEAGQRLLDVGCGWGGMVMHAAGQHDADAVGITLSTPQYDWATKAIAEQGAESQVQVRVQDYRDVDDGPYHAISSIGMFEHVGRVQLQEYFQRLFHLVKPGGRVLNHGISTQPEPDHQRRMVSEMARRAIRRPGFGERYVFPDGELHEVGAVVSIMQEVGFEVRHVESLREHYALTLRAWVANLEGNWDQAVSVAGEGRARVWRLYMAAMALNFEAGRHAIHQVLAVKPDGGRSGLPLRPDFR